MKAETKEQLKAKLNIAEEAVTKLEREAREALDGWERELRELRPTITKAAIAAFIAGCVVGGIVVWVL